MREKLITFIEVPVFSEDRFNYFSDEEYQKFQAYMIENHHLGDYIPHTGGCQKIRWKLENNHKGKSGGIRIIYYMMTNKGKIYLISAYAKSQKTNLSDMEKAIMKQIVQKLMQE